MCLGGAGRRERGVPGAKYQRCTVRFYCDTFSVTPRSKMGLVSKMLKAIYTQESKKAAREKAKAFVEEPRRSRMALRRC